MSFPDTIPNAEAHVWATMIPLRAPEFKVHKNEGLANSALGNRGVNEKFAKYELVEGLWHKRFEYIPPDKCERCSGPFVGKRPYESGRNKQKYFYKGPGYLAPILCNTCHASDYEEYTREARERREREQLAQLQAKYN